VVLTGLLFPLALLGADPHHDVKPYLAWILLLEAGLMGSFLSLDLFLFFIFFEIVLVPMYFLIGGWGYADRVYAAIKFFLFTMTGSAFMLVGILSTVFLYAQQNGGRLTFDVVFHKVLRTYYLLYPIMYSVFPLNSEAEVAQRAQGILRVTDPKQWMSKSYMPRTRDMSASRRMLLQAWCRKVLAV
jgi:NADH:ubiquinone oxidoreductase subunit 4 (subunit M)